MHACSHSPEECQRSPSLRGSHALCVCRVGAPPPPSSSLLLVLLRRHGPGNLYMFVVNPHPLEQDMLLALFPLNLGIEGEGNGDGEAFIGCSFSCDGREWSTGGSKRAPWLPRPSTEASRAQEAGSAGRRTTGYLTTRASSEASVGRGRPGRAGVPPPLHHPTSRAVATFRSSLTGRPTSSWCGPTARAGGRTTTRWTGSTSTPQRAACSFSCTSTSPVRRASST